MSFFSQAPRLAGGYWGLPAMGWGYGVQRGGISKLFYVEKKMLFYSRRLKAVALKTQRVTNVA